MMASCLASISFLLLSISIEVFAFLPSTSTPLKAWNSQLNVYHAPCDELNFKCSILTDNKYNRRNALANILLGGVITYQVGHARPVQALVDGSPIPKPKKSLGEEYRQGTAALSDTLEAELLPREAYNKLPSGVIYADINVGQGELAKEGSRVNLQWVLRRSNGYFVDSSAVSNSVPFIFTVGDPNGAIQGLDEGVRGMKTGGTRRILIPPKLAYVNGVDEGKPGPIPAGFGPRQQMRRVMQVRKDVPGEYIFLEVRLTKVRS